MKRLATALALGLLLLPTTASGQQTDSDQILAKATVIGALSIQGVRDLDFGTAVGGTTVTVGVDDPSAGKFQVTAQANSTILLSFTQIPTELTRSGGAETIPLTLVASAASVDDPGAGSDLPVEGTVNTIVFPASGQGFVWIGGTITPAVSQAVGNYEATIELTASYSNN
jgi:hypothetical protein